MWQIFILIGILIAAFQAVDSKKLSHSALWLALASALTSWLIYELGAPEIAVIELSVGAGVVTILLVFAINIVGDQQDEAKPLIPRFLALFIVIASVLLLGIFLTPIRQNPVITQLAAPIFAQEIWEDRILDTVLQIILLFSAVLGVLSLMEERNHPNPKNEENSTKEQEKDQAI